jgi:signal transduction histidine kinase
VRGIRREDTRWSTAYHLVSWLLLIGAQIANPGTESTLLFFVLFPQLWSMLPRWWAVLGTVLGIMAYSAVRWALVDFDRSKLPDLILSAVISIGISLGLGLFIDRIVDEARSRARAIDALRSAQDRLVAAERDRGVHEERERLSREIHDTLAQGFTSVLTLSRATSAALTRGDLDAVRERLALIEQTATDNLSEARLIVAELTPGHLQSRTLVEALQRLAGSMEAESGMTVELAVAGDPVPLGASAEIVLLRTAQEALSNVRRHAEARHTRVDLAYAAPSVTLTVTDDGVGLHEEATPGFGLDGLRARVAELGGEVEVGASIGGGTTLRVEVPR